MKTFVLFSLLILLYGCTNELDKCVEANAKQIMYESGGNLLDSDEVKKRKIANIIEIRGGDLILKCMKK